MATTMTTGWERRSTNGGLMALAGGALTVVGVFLPWVTGGGESFTGWELYDLRQEAGENPFVIDEMFDRTFDPFFTGAPVLVFGVAAGPHRVAVYAAKKRPAARPVPGQPRALHHRGASWRVGAVLMLVLNVFSILTPPAFVDVSMGLGLVVSFAGARPRHGRHRPERGQAQRVGCVARRPGPPQAPAAARAPARGRRAPAAQLVPGPGRPPPDALLGRHHLVQPRERQRRPERGPAGPDAMSDRAAPTPPDGTTVGSLG